MLFRESFFSFASVVFRLFAAALFPLFFRVLDFSFIRTNKPMLISIMKNTHNPIHLKCVRFSASLHIRTDDIQIDSSGGAISLLI